MGEKAIWLDIARASVRLYFHEPQASESTTQECNIQPYCLLTHQIIDLLYTTPIKQHLQHRQLLRMRSTKVIATCMFNELLAAGLFPALDSTSLCTDPSISERKYRARQHMPCGLSNTDHRIWENISHVALREILFAPIRGI